MLPAKVQRAVQHAYFAFSSLPPPHAGPLPALHVSRRAPCSKPCSALTAPFRFCGPHVRSLIPPTVFQQEKHPQEKDGITCPQTPPAQHLCEVSGKGRHH
eukprot:1159081-Pelagomonas_calceolata.AAC.10